MFSQLALILLVFIKQNDVLYKLKMQRHHNMINRVKKSDYRNKRQSQAEESYNEDSLIDQIQFEEGNAPDFESKNQIFEWKSKYNESEYQKAKLTISYENTIKQLRQKNNYLQNFASEKEFQNEHLQETLNEVNFRNIQLSKQISNLKYQFQGLFDKNRLTPNFSSEDLAGQSEILSELFKKDEQIKILQEELKKKRQNPVVRSSVQTFGETRLGKKESLEIKVKFEQEIVNLKQDLKNQKLQQQRKRKQYQIIISELNTKIKVIERQNAEFKQKLNERSSISNNEQNIKEQNKQLSLQIQYRDQKFKKSQNSKLQLETKINDFQIQLSKVKNQKNSLDQYNKYMETSLKQNEQRKKQLQEEINSISKELTEQRSLNFNTKMEAQKQINNLKLEFDEQKMKFLEQIDDQNKQIHKGKQLSLSSNRQNIQYDDLNKKINQLKNENEKLQRINSQHEKQAETLKFQVGQFQQKYHAKRQKLSVVEKQTRKQYEKRVQALEDEIYRLNIANQKLQGQLSKNKQQTKLNQPFKDLHSPVQSALSPRSTSKDDVSYLKDLIELLKIDKKNVEDENLLFKKKQSQKKQREENQALIIKNLERQIKDLRIDIRHLDIARQEDQEKIKMFSQMEIQIQRVSEQLKKERIKNMNKRRQEPLNFKNSQRQMEQLKRQNFDLTDRLSNLENQVSKKGVQLIIKQEQINKLKNQNPNHNYLQGVSDISKKNAFNTVSLENRMMEMQKQIQSIRNMKEKQLQEFKSKYKKNIQQKYDSEMKKIKDYSSQLEQNISLLHQKLNEKQSKSSRTYQDMSHKIEKLQKQNLTLKYEYSQSLEQINSLLIKYRHIEDNLKKMSANSSRSNFKEEEYEDLLSKYHSLLAEFNQNKVLFQNSSHQVKKLNQVLMNKEEQIKNKTFICPHINETKLDISSSRDYYYQRKSKNPNIFIV